jgi:hypothetical protein
MSILWTGQGTIVGVLTADPTPKKAGSKRGMKGARKRGPVQKKLFKRGGEGFKPHVTTLLTHQTRRHWSPAAQPESRTG